MKVLIIGAGYIGTALARIYVAQGATVWAVRRHASEDDPSIRNVNLVVADICQPSTLDQVPLEVYDLVVNCVSSEGEGVEGYRRNYFQGMKNLTRWLQSVHPKAFIFTSSISVYSQLDGSWVDEYSPCDPPHETGQILRSTEEIVLDFGGTVLRLAGIYGPHRLHAIKRFETEENPLKVNGVRWVNSIHRDDVLTAILRVARQRVHGEIFNVTDDQPATQLEYYTWIAEKLSKPPPVNDLHAQHHSDRKQTVRGGFSANRRVRNSKLRERLGWAPRFPSFREGYCTILKKVTDG